MAEAQEVQLQIIGQETKESDSFVPQNSTNQAIEPQKKGYSWWIRVSIYTIFLLCGQTTAIILGRLYFVKGGASKWMATLVQICGFPVLIPFYFFNKVRTPITNNTNTKSASPLKLAAIYIIIGLILGTDCYLYSIGMQYLPVSTYTLICSSQLAFNAFFSFFLNKQKFTALIINSLVLLTISSVLLVFNNESDDDSVHISRAKYAIGFACTVLASAGFGFILSLTQLAFAKVIKSDSLKAIIDMMVYQEIVATAFVVVGLFASGEWNDLTKEMDKYKMGKVSYLMNLSWTAITWQVFFIGSVGLIYEVGSLFSNAIMMVGLPIVPVLALFVFHDKMDGVKAIAMVLAVWGFLSYVYQHYLDDQKYKVDNCIRNGNEIVSKSFDNTVN